MTMLFVIFIVIGVVSAVDNAASGLWPLPWKITSGSGATTLSGDFTFQPKSSANSILADAFNRYSQLINVPVSAAGSLKSCSVSVSEESIPKEVIGSDESYTLHVDETSCAISAATTWGALRGLETFSQLLARGADSVALSSLPIDISDKPRYGHRGLLIDTARHYISVEEIQRVVAAMPASKLNALHWHAVDAESFPLDPPSEPSMVKGAFPGGRTYSMQDLAAVSAFALARGVQLVLELDMPGHAASWAAGKKEVMADCFVKYSYNINDFALNPAKDETYIVVQNILTDVTLAANSYKLHLGGDEVVYGCWKNDSSITAYMQANGVKDYDAMLTSFAKRVDNNILGTSRQINAVIHWEEVFVASKSALPKASTIFQVWTDSSMMAQVTAASYRTLASPSNFWYLNIPSNTWQVMYGYDPATGLSAQQSSFVIGGEAALWGEYVDDLNMEASLYPRLAAVAERLWSDPKQTASTADALPRLLAQRCRLVGRGVASAPVQPGGYCTTNYI